MNSDGVSMAMVKFDDTSNKINEKELLDKNYTPLYTDIKSSEIWKQRELAKLHKEVNDVVDIKEI